MKGPGMRMLRRRRRPGSEELNITAFMNLMVILVPFLLITAVFSRMAVLELNLPEPGAHAGGEPPALNLELVLTGGQVTVRDAAAGPIETVTADADGGWSGLSPVLLTIKRRFPDVEAATLRVAPDVDYQAVVRVMDRLRAARVTRDGEQREMALFPAISLADAEGGSS